MSRWVSVTGARSLWFQFWQDSHKLPRAVWYNWATTLALGLGISALMTLGLTRYSQGLVEHGPLQAWDETMLLRVAETLPLSFARAITWESPGSLVGALPVVIIFVSVMVERSRPLLAASMMAGYGLQFSLVWLGWGIWNRPRPDLIAAGLAAPDLHSFPSGHATVVCIVYGLLAYLWGRASRNGWEKLVIALLFTGGAGLVGSARLVLGAHWPSDVIAGFAIGLVWLATVIIALERAYGSS